MESTHSQPLSIIAAGKRDKRDKWDKSRKDGCEVGFLLYITNYIILLIYNIINSLTVCLSA